jgi:polysaccharide biosynthesis protein PslH
VAERLCFVLGKDPATEHGGDMRMSDTMRTIASERFEVEIICLSERLDLDVPGVVRVQKPPISWGRLVGASVVRRRSLVHTRFDIDGLRDAMERSSADRFVVEHSYMAESFLRAAGKRPTEDLLVSTDVSESDVLHRVRGRVAWPEVRRLRRDEFRIAAAARSVGGYDRNDMAEYRAAGHDAHWLPMTLAPKRRIDVAAAPPRLVLLGNRTWRPNAQAAELMLRLWPRIAVGIPDAELWLVGPRATVGAQGATGAGVVDLGFVPDVDEVLGQCRALAAPVVVGTGVRVKLLESATLGLPVVATPNAVGSIEASLGMLPAADEDDFVRRSRAFLLDPDLAEAEGARLHAANKQRWLDRVGHDAVLDWLSR